MKAKRNRFPRIFYWVEARLLPGGERLLWVPSVAQWLPRVEALTLSEGPCGCTAWIIVPARSLSRARRIAGHSHTGATIRRMNRASGWTGKQWNLPARTT